MPIEIVVTDEFVQWWESLDEDEQISVRSLVDLWSISWRISA
jgi:hypothetical protein